MPPRSAGAGASPGTSISAGTMRSSTPAASASGTSVSVNAPEARLSHAIPARFPCGRNAASRQSRLASSRLASVSVPGVTMRAIAPLHRPLARRRIAELLDDHHRLAMLHELREMRLERVVRHAGHRDGCAGRLPARRQRDVEQPRRVLGVGVEEFVEVAHPVEDELVRMLRLGAQVLLHHRRVAERGASLGRRAVIAVDFKSSTKGSLSQSKLPRPGRWPRKRSGLCSRTQLP